MITDRKSSWDCNSIFVKSISVTKTHFETEFNCDCLENNFY